MTYFCAGRRWKSWIGLHILFLDGVIILLIYQMKLLILRSRSGWSVLSVLLSLLGWSDITNNAYHSFTFVPAKIMQLQFWSSFMAYLWLICGVSSFVYLLTLYCNDCNYYFQGRSVTYLIRRPPSMAPTHSRLTFTPDRDHFRGTFSTVSSMHSCCSACGQ